jgi:tRNA nucleotidyltransferase/poly(A) polymerase
MEEFKFYEVGGCVRDELLGLKSKDIGDYVWSWYVVKTNNRVII